MMFPQQYVKKHYQEVQISNRSRSNNTVLLLGKGLIITGIFIFGSVFLPILSYELFTAPTLRNQAFVNPLPDQQQAVILEDSNLLNPSDWFPSAQVPADRVSKITHYTLSIPKFNIIDATVAIGGKDLSKNLIQYPGSALPGELGATIIFGHSILPQFFNPKNYMAIFSYLPSLELGDEVIAKFDGISFTYRVIDKTEVKPDNLRVLEQAYDNEYLRLITCTPPGTYLRRAVITAVLIKT